MTHSKPAERQVRVHSEWWVAGWVLFACAVAFAVSGLYIVTRGKYPATGTGLLQVSATFAAVCASVVALRGQTMARAQATADQQERQDAIGKQVIARLTGVRPTPEITAVEKHITHAHRAAFDDASFEVRVTNFGSEPVHWLALSVAEFNKMDLTGSATASLSFIDDTAAHPTSNSRDWVAALGPQETASFLLTLHGAARRSRLIRGNGQLLRPVLSFTDPRGNQWSSVDGTVWAGERSSVPVEYRWAVNAGHVGHARQDDDHGS